MRIVTLEMFTVNNERKVMMVFRGRKTILNVSRTNQYVYGFYFINIWVDSWSLNVCFIMYYHSNACDKVVCRR